MSTRKSVGVFGMLGAVVIAAPMLTAAEPEGAVADARALAKFDAKITDDDRGHWAFQPVQPVGVPDVKDSAWVRNPIDRFVLAGLEEKGWKPSPQAAPRALLRRIYFDVIGLPPTPDEQAAFLADPSPQALDRVVDDLLSRPSYGERWARHWLDLVRFAESNGYERDATKPYAWRYRDYVIRAFNHDMPYDRFVLEQLAGDELPDANAETLVATGFTRLGPWDDEPADPQQDRFDQLDDLAATTSEVFLGLTLGCARCHDHKFEPLTMHDYYRMIAVFDPLDRPRLGRFERDLPIGTREQIAAQRDRDHKIESLQRDVARVREAWHDEYLASGKSALPAEAIEAFRAEPRKRSDAQKGLVEKHQAQLDKELLATMPLDVRQKVDAANSEINWIRETQPDLPRGYFMHEPDPVPPTTHLLLRGRAAQPGPAVGPGVPAVLVRSQPKFPAGPSGPTSQRRLALARWIASPNNPLTARVIVNRVWQYHFGQGLVRTPSDFGTMGDPPTHPELLDWLAGWFVKEGWSLKKLHKLILTSSTCRMSKASREDCAAEDPDDRLLWRVPYRRLEVEAIRDAMLSASGQLDPHMFGPSMHPFVPREAIAAHTDPDKVWPAFNERESSRRTVYAFIKRSMVVPMIEVLDFCDTARSTAQRNITSIAPQALTLLNGDFTNRQAAHLAERLLKEAGDDAEKQVERMYVLALCRPPSDQERSSLVSFMDHEARSLQDEASSAGRKLEPADARKKALEQAARIAFNLNEFMYTD